MPRVPKKNIDPNLGHGCSPSFCLTDSNQPVTVTIEDQSPILLGDVYEPHSYCPGPNHFVPTALASLTVFVNDRPLVKEGDILGCGDIAAINPAVPTRVFAEDVFNASLPGGGAGGGGGGTGGGSAPNQVSLKTFPIATYPNRVITTYRVDQQNRYQNHCPVSIKPTNAYTPLMFNNQEVRNYPGPPITVKSGAEELPNTVNREFRDPIPLKFKFVTNPKQYELNINEDTGEITGYIPLDLRDRWLPVSYFVGFGLLGRFYFPDDAFSSPFRQTFLIRLQRTFSC